jgi:hypothetical protein
MIPADKILPNQYTRGNEYVLVSTGEYYQGYYCVVTDTKYYTGKTYDNKSKELSKVTLISKKPLPTSLPPQSTSIRYFIKKINVFPTIIKEVSEQTYSSYKNDPFYQTIAIVSDENLDRAEAQMPGIKTFLLG